MTKITSPSLGRRSFLTAFGLCGVAGSHPAIASQLQAKAPFSDCKTFHATCPMECLHCNLKGYVNAEGKIVKIESDNPHTGKACGRGLSRMQWMYSKDRVLTPLLRTGPKGSGQFKPVSWDEALDLVAEKMKEAIAKDGPESLLFTSRSGNMDNLCGPVQARFGQYLGGVTGTIGALCCSAVSAAMENMVGPRCNEPRDTIEDAKYLLCWGNNPVVTMSTYWPLFLKAKERGAKIIVIDPRKSETARRADAWYPIYPGTDTALALGMIRYIHKNLLEDTDFLKKRTGAAYLVDKDGKLLRLNPADKNSYAVFDLKTESIVPHDKDGVDPALNLLKPVGGAARTVYDMVLAEAEPWTPQAVEKETGVKADAVGKIARDYATSGASMIVDNMGGFQRTEYGTYAVASHFLLSLITGNIGREGTGVLDQGGAPQMAKFGSAIAAPDKKPVAKKPIPVSLLAQYLLEDKPCKINLWYAQACAPIGSWPNTNLMVKAIKKLPFFVVADSLMTPTAKLADVVLPVTTVFEYDSVMAGNRTHFVQLIEKAVEPQGEAKPDYWIWAQLAKRMGFGEAFDLSPEQLIRNVLKPSGITYEDIKKAPVHPYKGKWIPFKDKFMTPTGKANLYCEAWIKDDFLPVVTYLRAHETPKGNPELAKKYPLQAVQRKVTRNIHTSHQANVWLEEIYPDKPTVLITPKDAAARGLKDGELAVVFNDRGEHVTRVVITKDLMPGVVVLENGWWLGRGGNTPSSVLTNDTREVLGNGTSICTTLVNVKKA